MPPDSDDEFAGCFGDAEVISLAPPEAGAALDRAAEIARIHRLVACLEEDELVAACERLEAPGLPLDDEDGSVDADSLSPKQLLVLSQELDKALFGKPVPSSEPLFRWQEESAKVNSPGKAGEPSEPPTKRARTPEEESPVCPDVLVNDAAGERCAGDCMAADVDENLLAVIDQCWGS